MIIGKRATWPATNSMTWFSESLELDTLTTYALGICPISSSSTLQTYHCYDMRKSEIMKNESENVIG